MMEILVLPTETIAKALVSQRQRVLRFALSQLSPRGTKPPSTPVLD